jgi:hypothetical protein
MEFNKAYNRAEFLEFLKGSFLPEKDFTKEETILNFPVQTIWYRICRGFLFSARSCNCFIKWMYHQYHIIFLILNL